MTDIKIQITIGGGHGQFISANVQAGHATSSQFYNLVSPNGTIFIPPKGRCWVYNENRMKDEILKKKYLVWYRWKRGSKDKEISSWRSGGRILKNSLVGISNVGTTESAKKHILTMFPKEKVFDTPKPEELIKRILEIATDRNDLVMDCYLGSGLLFQLPIN